MSASSLSIKIENVNPVSLADLTLSLLDISNQYTSYCKRERLPVNVYDNQLYIREARQGSLIIDLITPVLQLLPVINNTDILLGFANFLFNSYEFFLGKKETPPINYTRKDLQQIKNSLNTTSYDRYGAKYHLDVHDGATVIFNQTINNIEAGAIQNGITKRLIEMGELIQTEYSKVMMTWYQARFDLAKDVGDWAIINKIYPDKPVKVIFDNKKTKNAIMLKNEKYPDCEMNLPIRRDLRNFFLWHELAYIVDVEVDLVNDKPKVYKIMNCYLGDTFHPEEQ